MKRKYSLLAVMALAIVAAGCSSADKGNAGQPAATDVPAAFTQNCAACHGNGLEGRNGPNLTKVGSKLSQDQIKTKIEKGGNGMPGFEKTLSADQINTLATWLASKK